MLKLYTKCFAFEKTKKKNKEEALEEEKERCLTEATLGEQLSLLPLFVTTYPRHTP
jgi:hypothetical protein